MIATNIYVKTAFFFQMVQKTILPSDKDQLGGDVRLSPGLSGFSLTCGHCLFAM